MAGIPFSRQGPPHTGRSLTTRSSRGPVLPPCPPFQTYPGSSSLFTIPTAYNHAPKEPPPYDPSQAVLPASMDPGLEEALRRERHRVAKAKGKAAASALPHQDHGIAKENEVPGKSSSSTSTAQGQQPPATSSSKSPEASSGKNIAEMATDSNISTLRTRPRYSHTTPLPSGSVVKSRLRNSNYSVEGRARPFSLTTSNSPSDSVRASMITSAQGSPVPYKLSSHAHRSDESITLRRSESDRARNRTSACGTISSSAETLISSRGRRSTSHSPSSTLLGHGGKTLPCPVHGYAPVYNMSNEVRNSSGKREAAPTAPMVRTPIPFQREAIPYALPSKCVAVEEQSQQAALAAYPQRGDVSTSAIPKEPAPSGTPYLDLKKITDKSALTHTTARSPTASIKGRIVNLVAAEQQYAILQALHTIEMERLAPHTGASILSARSGCEAIFMPRPTLTLASEHDGRSTACGWCCCDDDGEEIEAVADDVRLRKQFSASDGVLRPRNNFERNRKPPEVARLQKIVTASLPDLRFSGISHGRPFLEEMMPILDPSKIQHGAPERADSIGSRPAILPLMSTATSDIKPEHSTDDNNKVAIPEPAVRRLKSEPRITRFASMSEYKDLGAPALHPSPSESTTTLGSRADSIESLDAKEVIRFGRELEQERKRWRSEFQHSLEGRSRSGTRSLGVPRSRLEEKRREDVLREGPYHSRLRLRRSKHKVLMSNSPQSRPFSRSAFKARFSQSDSRTAAPTATAAAAAAENSGREVKGAPVKAGGFSAKKDLSTAQQTWSDRGGEVTSGKASAVVRGLPSPPLQRGVKRVDVPSSTKPASGVNRLRKHPLAPSEQSVPPHRHPPTSTKLLPSAPPVAASAAMAFELATAGQHSKKIGPRFSSGSGGGAAGGGGGGETPSGKRSKDLASDELFVFRKDLVSSGGKSLDFNKKTIGPPALPSVPSRISSQVAASTGEPAKQSLSLHQGNESMLALDAERLLLEEGTSSRAASSVERLHSSPGGHSAGTPSSRRELASSPPPRPAPDEPLPSLPTPFSTTSSSAPAPAAQQPGPDPDQDPTKKETSSLLSQSLETTSGEGSSSLPKQRSIGRPDSFLEPPYDEAPATSDGHSPPQPTSSVLSRSG